jgi:hypothetical protein
MNFSPRTTRTAAAARALCSALLLIAAAAFPGCDRDGKGKAGTGPTPKKDARVPDKAEWTAEEIAKDPVGYIRWSERKIDREVAEREARLASLAVKKKQFADKAQMLEQNLEDVETLRTQAARALKRAEDNDSWPAVVAGKPFERGKLERLIPELQKYVEERRPTQQSYADFLAKITRTEQLLQNQIAQARDLKERLAIDAQSIELNQSTADLSKLTRSQEQLVSMSNSLRNMSDDPSNAAPPGEPPGRVKIEELIK